MKFLKKMFINLPLVSIVKGLSTLKFSFVKPILIFIFISIVPITLFTILAFFFSISYSFISWNLQDTDFYFPFINSFSTTFDRFMILLGIMIASIGGVDEVLK